MRRIPNPLLVILYAVLVLAIPAACGAEVVDRIVAVVNDEIITMSELQNMAKAMEAQSGRKPTGIETPEVQRQLLEVLINNKLAKSEAKRKGITVSDKEVDEVLQQMKKRNNISDDETLAKVLTQQGTTLKELRQQIHDKLMQERLMTLSVGSKVMIGDSEIRRFYEEHYKSSGGGGGGGLQLHLKVIKLPYPPGATPAQQEEIKQKAEAILQDIQKGVPFTEAAHKVSVSTEDLGFVNQSDLDPQLMQLLVSLKPQQVAPLHAPNGFQLIQVEDRREGSSAPTTRTLEEASPEIRRILMEKEMDRQFGEWVKTLREKAHIKVML